MAASAGRVLEIGCGAGRLLRKLQTRAHVAIGADLSQDALARATLVAPGRLVRARAEALPVSSRSFDAVVAGYHVFSSPSLDWPRAFAEVARVLVPDGVFVFTTWTRLGLTVAGWLRALAERRLPTDDERRPKVPLLGRLSKLDGLLDHAGLPREYVWGLPMLGPIRRVTGPIRIRAGVLAPLCYEVVIQARRR